MFYPRVRMTPIGPIIGSEHNEGTKVVSPAVKEAQELFARTIE